ncbi:MAG: hypothetical protein H6656_13140 [Ardenticatenaceae bacterium]|nr:hypothetical protein [Ardenticatenaceae bacterium]
MRKPCSTIPLDEIKERIVNLQNNLAVLLKNQPIDSFQVRLNTALVAIVESTLLFFPNKFTLNAKQEKSLEFILYITCNLFSWLEETIKQVPSFSLPLDERAPDQRITPSQYFWWAASYEIGEPINGLVGFCHLLALEDSENNDFKKLLSTSVPLRNLWSDIRASLIA